MNPPSPRHISAALRFLAELNAVAAEFAASGGAWDDELTARRRLRDDSRGSEILSEERQVKAL